MKISGRFKIVSGLIGFCALASGACASVTDDFTALQLQLNETLLDVYAGTPIAPENAPVKLWQRISPSLQSAMARRLMDNAARDEATATIAAPDRHNPRLTPASRGAGNVATPKRRENR